MYGILPVRRNGGQVGFICEKPNGDGLKYVFYDNTLSKVSFKFSILKFSGVFISKYYMYMHVRQRNFLASQRSRGRFRR